MNFSGRQAQTLNEILRWRRDVRHFRADPIPEPVLDRLRAAMDLAPSVGNSRPWRVLQIKDKSLRGRVQEIFETCNREAAAPYDEPARAEYVRLKLAGLREAPVHLAVFTETAPMEGRGLGRQTMPETLQFSTAMAIHTLWLVARAENIGLGWVSILDPMPFSPFSTSRKAGYSLAISVWDTRSRLKNAHFYTETAGNLIPRQNGWKAGKMTGTACRSSSKRPSLSLAMRWFKQTSDG
jgi:5,6-dimethylbenzimidazole synthase